MALVLRISTGPLPIGQTTIIPTTSGALSVTRPLPPP
jgi:hypothetical protein